MKRSLVVGGNDKARLDSRYFARAPMALAARVAMLPHRRLGDLCDSFRKGIFDIKADSYVDERGVPFVRVGDLRSGLVDFDVVARISNEAHLKEIKTALGQGDIVLSKTAYAAAAIVSVGACNTSQDTIAARLSKEAREAVRPGYIVSYLNSVSGKALAAREFQGNVQEHLGLGDAAAILIPVFDTDLHISVDDLVTNAEHFGRGAKSALDEAEALVLDALGLRDWSPSEPLTYMRSARDVSAAGRLDAQYYQPAKAEMLSRLAALDGAPLSDSFDVIRDLVDPRHDPTARCRNYDLTDALQPVLDSSKELVTFADMESQKVRFRDGDLAVARLRAYLREIAVVRVEDDMPSVGSSEFYVLRRKPNVPTMSAEALMAYLRAPPVQTILKWCQDGSQHPRFAERDLMSIPLPDCVIALNGDLTAIVDKALSRRARAAALLDAAKRAVEIAIEDGEPAALSYISQLLEGVDAAAI